MTSRAGWMIGVCVVLVLGWLIWAAPWQSPDIQVIASHRDGRGGPPLVMIAFNQAYEISEVVVHKMIQNEDGEWQVPRFGLESDPVWKIIPRGADTRQIQAVMYGDRPRGFRNEVRPKALEPDGIYRATITTTRGIASVDFGGSPQAHQTIEAEADADPEA